MAYSLTTNQATYHVGQPIQMTFTETNTSTKPVSIGIGPSNSGFDVVHDGMIVWASNAGIQPQYIRLETLQPGQSVTLNATWNGIPNRGPTSIPTGSFTVTNQQAPAGASATFTIQPAPAGQLTFTLTTDQSTYQVGQPINMTFTESNTSTQPVTISLGPTNTGFDVVHDGTVVWKSNAGNQPLVPVQLETLQPGQSVTLNATWNGIPNEGSLVVLTGSFSVTNQQAPTGAIATFQIEPQAGGPVTTTLTTDKSTYLAGQPINMTFTETNQGNQPVNVIAGSGTFEVTQNGAPVWNSAFPNFPWQDLSWQTLQHGQTLTETATWNGVLENQSSPGLRTFTLTNELAPSDSASFQIFTPVVDPIPTPTPAPIPVTPPPVPVTPPPVTVTPPPVSVTPPPVTVTPPPVTVTPPPVSVTAAAISVTLTTDKSAYQVGHAVVMAFTLTNTSDQTVSIAQSAAGNGFSVSRGSLVIWRHLATGGPDASLSIAPGQSITFTTTWNGKPNQAHVKLMHPGIYTLVAEGWGYHVTTTIRIGKRASARAV